MAPILFGIFGTAFIAWAVFVAVKLCRIDGKLNYIYQMHRKRLRGENCGYCKFETDKANADKNRSN